MIFKNILITFGLLQCMVMHLYGQEQIKSLSDNVTIIYHLKDNNSLDGLYTLKGKDGQTLLRGIYKDGERAGNWFAFNKDKSVFIRYNYDVDKLLQLDTNQMKSAAIRVSGKNAETSKNARICFPVFPLEVYVDLIKARAQKEIPTYQRSPQTPILAEITAEIDNSGNVNYNMKYIYDNKTFNTQFKYNEKYLEFGWIPAQYQSKTLPSEFKIFAEYTFPDAPDHKRVIWN